MLPPYTSNWIMLPEITASHKYFMHISPSPICALIWSSNIAIENWEASILSLLLYMLEKSEEGFVIIRLPKLQRTTGRGYSIMHMYVRIQVMPFILPQKSVWPCTIAASPGLKSNSTVPPSSPLSFPSPMIAILILLHVAAASCQTWHHSGTWGCVDSRRSPPLGRWVQSVHE